MTSRYNNDIYNLLGGYMQMNKIIYIITVIICLLLLIACEDNNRIVTENETELETTAVETVEDIRKYYRYNPYTEPEWYLYSNFLKKNNIEFNQKLLWGIAADTRNEGLYCVCFYVHHTSINPKEEDKKFYYDYLQPLNAPNSFQNLSKKGVEQRLETDGLASYYIYLSGEQILSDYWPTDIEFSISWLSKVPWEMGLPEKNK